MQTIEYSSFLPEVLPYVRDCPEFVAINAIRNACIEFCENSLYWREVLPAIVLEEGEALYDLDLPVGTGVAKIISAGLGYKNLTARVEEELREILGEGWRTRPGPVQYYLQDEIEQIRVVMVPDQTYEDDLIVTAALRPTRASTKVGKIVYERFAEVIGFGARARLHDTPGQPYFNETAAKKFRAWFETGYGEAKIDVNRGLSRANLVVRPPRI